MKVSDYIVEYLIDKRITDVFGYPGGMVTHLLDSFSKYDSRISAHLAYHEQAAAFAACGYAQASNKVGVAYATSGPGATNLITGICQAYYDSIPVLFITGQVNRNELSNDKNIRQVGFQETDIVAITSKITKLSIRITNPEDIKYILDKCFYYMLSERKGPCLLDIPMDVLSSDIDKTKLKDYVSKNRKSIKKNINKDIDFLKKIKRPVIIVGNGLKNSKNRKKIEKSIRKLNIPVVSSMLAVDTFINYKYNYGFIGAYGNRTANFIVSKSDLIISIGSRLDIRQVGKERKKFASKAQIIRFDVDDNELNYKVHSNDISYKLNIDCDEDCTRIIEYLSNINIYNDWLNICEEIKLKLNNYDRDNISKTIHRISDSFPDNCMITTDVGQNQVWCAQSLTFKKNQKVLFSGSEGAMGYALPAAIGAYYATRKKVFCICGDGGLQMNIQELQFLYREQLPITIILLNNKSLGMIRHFQEMYFKSNYFHTISNNGYSTPDFEKIAKAYKIKYIKISLKNNKVLDINSKKPMFFEIELNKKTYVKPKLVFGQPNQDQDPKINRKLYEYLNNL